MWGIWGGRNRNTEVFLMTHIEDRNDVFCPVLCVKRDVTGLMCSNTNNTILTTDRFTD